MAEAMHCDREGCDTWTKTPEAVGFLAVNWWGEWCSKMDFCSWDCIIRYGATKPPTKPPMEVIGND